MRTLLLMRGAPGSGKSTWIKKHNLQNYTICPDDIRLQLASVMLNPDGTRGIIRDFNVEKKVWGYLFDILEYRMSRGEFTVIDATCSKTKDISQYKKIADKYRYRIYIVDFTKVPLETCLHQNRQRDAIKWVPDEQIEMIYSRFATQQIPGGITVVQPDEFDKVLEEPIDLSEYKRLVFIGDIHGCYDTLMQYPDFKEGLKDDTEYIFLGDYVDRGNQNYEVLEFLEKIKELPNVCLLEGNHERWISRYGNDEEIQSKVFLYKTVPELEEKGYDKKRARMLYRKLRQFSHIKYNGIEILACHGGIPNLYENLLYLPTCTFINGCGEYIDVETNAESWTMQTKDSQYLIHGHRNPYDVETQMTDRVFNLDGHVENGGEIRIVELVSEYLPEYGTTEEGHRIAVGMNTLLKWNVVTLQDIQPITKDLDTTERPVVDVESAIEYLRNNDMIEERNFGNISSFNFSREAFTKRRWNEQTILARGFFVDIEKKKIAIRSYNKFFNIDERRETELANLKNKLQFPVKAYLKYNGFLALISYDKERDTLLIASKGSLMGDYVGYIKNQVNGNRYNSIIQWFRRNNEDVTLVFECIDPENDPHIIKYPWSKLVLLDVVRNEIEFSCYDYEDVIKVAAEIGTDVKRLARTFETFDELRNFYNGIQSYYYKDSFLLTEDYVEGYVFEDANGYKVKAKTGYYKEWKKLRGVADVTMRCGTFLKTGQLFTKLENEFYGFSRELFKEDEAYYREHKEHSFKTDIISLRDMFYEKKLNDNVLDAIKEYKEFVERKS